MANKFVKILGLLLALFALHASAADKLKVVYHLTELERVPFVIGNIENHIKGVGGPENVEIILVVHGPALKAFEKSNTDPKLLDRLGLLKTKGLEFDACGNTLQKEKLNITDLADGFVKVDQGGVVRIAELQHAGYIYIRP
ncbi:MAG TPA: DsrE family protein [Rhodocyclaceae bacterium]|nr:DsrE family protein [Rhodocyclaceae bacterium]